MHSYRCTPGEVSVRSAYAVLSVVATLAICNVMTTIYWIPCCLDQQLQCFERRSRIFLFKIFIYIPIFPPLGFCCPERPHQSPPPPAQSTVWCSCKCLHCITDGQFIWSSKPEIWNPFESASTVMTVCFLDVFQKLWRNYWINECNNYA
jgi:hypothetical protein